MVQTTLLASTPSHSLIVSMHSYPLLSLVFRDFRTDGSVHTILPVHDLDTRGRLSTSFREISRVGIRSTSLTVVLRHFTGQVTRETAILQAFGLAEGRPILLSR